MALSNLSSFCLFSLPTTLDLSTSTSIIRNHKPLPSIILRNSNNNNRSARRRRLGECRAAIVEDTDKEVLLPPETGEEEKKQEAAEYDWREEWYPLYLTAEVPDDAPLGLTVFHKQIVLYRDGQGVLRCYEDRCPHRLAKLSEGQLIDGRLECLYHGWQFEGDGKCVKIPQVSENFEGRRAVENCQ